MADNRQVDVGKAVVLIFALGLVLVAAAFLLTRPAAAQEEFTWEGFWNLYQDINDNKIQMEVIRNADASYSVNLENANQSQDDWHPPLDNSWKVTINQYTMQIVMVGSYEGTIFSYVEMNFERTDNPEQLRGTYYARSEHQFSGNELGWNIVDNFIELDVVALCAAREGVSPPEPCMALGDAFVPPEEEETSEDAEEPASEGAATALPVTLYCQPYPQPNGNMDISCGAEIYPPEDSGDWVVDWYLDGAYASSQTVSSGNVTHFFPDVQPGTYTVTVHVTNTDLTVTLAGSGALSVLVEAAESGQADDTTGGSDASQAPESQDAGTTGGADSQSAGTGLSVSSSPVSPQAQAAAAVGTTGLLAFWTIWEILSWAPISGSHQNNSLLNNLASLLSSSGTGSLSTPPTPSVSVGQPVPQSQPASSPVKNPPYTGSGIKETAIFDGADVHTILQALELIPANVKPGDTYTVTQAQLDALLAGHPDGLPHEVTLPNGNVVIIDNIQGIAFHGEGAGTEIDFSEGISIAAEVVRPGQAPPPPQTPSSGSSADSGSGGTSGPNAGSASAGGTGTTPTTILGQTPGSTAPPAGNAGTAGSDGPDVSSGGNEITSDVDLLNQTPANDEEIDTFFSGGSSGAEDGSAGYGGDAAVPQEGDAAVPQEGGGGEPPEMGGEQTTISAGDEYSHQETDELVHKVDELLDDLSDSTIRDPGAGGNSGLVDGDPDLPEAGMIDGEINSAMDDF